MITYRGSLFVTEDAERTKAFYKEILGLRVIQDFNANFTLKGGISFQTKESWKTMIHKEEVDITYGSNDAELYFEADDIDAFAEKLMKHSVTLIHPLQEQEWGQKVIRFYDPDQHIIEVAEKMDDMIKRLSATGMSIEQISTKTMLSEKMVLRLLHK